MSDTSKQKVYFENLDGIRFLLFLPALLNHCWVSDKPNLKADPILKGAKDFIATMMWGHNALTFFFILSSFLITYLILKEIRLKGKLNIRNFWIRRALRIWPLYYFIIFFAFVIYPALKYFMGQSEPITANFWNYFFFISNFEYLWHGHPKPEMLGILWTLAIEEQFYLFWPLIFIFVPVRRVIWAFLALFIVSMASRVAFADMNGYRFMHTLCVMCDMVAGGLAAYLVLYNERFLNFCRNMPRWFIYFVYIGALFTPPLRGLWKENVYAAAFERVVYCFFFVMIILEQCYAEKSFFKFSKFKWLTELGKYTYGLYMLHMVAMLVVFTSFRVLHLDDELWEALILRPFVTLLFSIVFAYFSYKYFELPFIKLKDKFAYFTKGKH